MFGEEQIIMGEFNGRNADPQNILNGLFESIVEIGRAGVRRIRSKSAIDVENATGYIVRPELKRNIECVPDNGHLTYNVNN